MRKSNTAAESPWRRRHALLLAAASLPLLTAGRASATQFLYDGFNYTAGDRLGGAGTSPLGQIAPNGEQWITRSPAAGGSYNPVNDTLITPGSLTYLGLAPGSGNSVRYGSSVSGGGAGKYVNAIRLPGALSITSGSVYYSAIVRFNGTTTPDPAAAVAPGGVRHSYMSLSTDTANPNTDAGFGVSSAGGGGGIPLPAGAWLRDSGTTDYHFGSGKQNSDGMGTSGGAPSWQSSAPPHPFANQQGNTAGTGQDEATIAADTWFVTLKYTFVAGTTSDDLVSMWINPIASTLGDNAGESTASGPGGSYYSAINATITAPVDAAQIQSFMLLGIGQTVNTSKTIDTTLDELRIGTTWADVTSAALTWDGDAAGGSNPSDTSGAWEGAGNWYNGANQNWSSTYSAVFGTGTGSGTTAVALAVPQSAGKIVFTANSPTYTISGSAITLNSADGEGVVANQSATITADVNLAASQLWSVASGSTLTAGRIIGSAADLNKKGAGTLEASPSSGSSLDVNNLTVSAGTLKTSGADASSMNSVSVNTAAGAELDVNNGGLIIKGDTVTNVRALLLAGSGGAGFAAQTWDQPGINSSDAAVDPLTYGVGYMDNDNFILGAKGTFDGVTVPGGAILVKSTLSGDADLDWDVDDDDVTVLGIFYGGAGHWYEADFDYTGFVDDDDVTIIGITYGQSLPGAAGAAAVPEPGSLILIAIGALGLASRRRLRRS